MFCWSGVAAAQTADFDGFAEGFTSDTIVDGGLTFTNLDNRGLTPVPGPLSIERADGTLTGLPGFTADNALGFGGFSMGPAAAFGRFGALEISSGSVASSAEVHVFENGNPGLSLTMEALSGGIVVDSDTVALAGGFGLAEHTLAVVGPFDGVRLTAGPGPTDAAFLLLDHVVFAAGGGHSGAPPTHSADPHTGQGAAPTGHTGPVVGSETDADTDTDTDADTDTDTDTDTDGGTNLPAPEDKGGCGCAAGPSAVGSPFAVGLVVAGRRRRR